MTTKIGIGVLVIAALLGVASFLGFGLHRTSHGVGSSGNAAETYYNSQWLVGGIQVGPTGTLNANTQFGSCNPTFYGTSLAATSTGVFVCPTPGVQPGDVIVADPPKGAGTVTGGPSSLAGGFVITAAYSTTTGITAFNYLNLTGAATSSFSQATTGVEYITWR